MTDACQLESLEHMPHCSVMGGKKRYARPKPSDPLKRHRLVLGDDREKHALAGRPTLVCQMISAEDWKARVIYVRDLKRGDTIEGWLSTGSLRPAASHSFEWIVAEAYIRARAACGQHGA